MVLHVNDVSVCPFTGVSHLVGRERTVFDLAVAVPPQPARERGKRSGSCEIPHWGPTGQALADGRSGSFQKPYPVV
jgi:hypothetical protein